MPLDPFVYLAQQHNTTLMLIKRIRSAAMELRLVAERGRITVAESHQVLAPRSHEQRSPIDL